MAKDKPEGKKEGGGKFSTIIIVLVIILVWLAVFAVLIKFDVGGFGSGVLYPVLKDVPVVNMILPESDEAVDLDKGESYSSIAQAEQRIKELEKKLEAYESGNTANTDYITKLENEVKNLKVYKDTQDAFEKRVLEFDEKVVFGDEAPSTEEYKAYYEQIAPENAEKIYKQVVEQHRYSEKIKNQAEAYSKMEASKAAAILQEMTAGDLDLVAGILSEMGTSKSSAILAEMDVQTAAQITKKMTSK